MIQVDEGDGDKRGGQKEKIEEIGETAAEFEVY
jgi:hypothetical protein